jgi:hypothetical protein
MTTYLPGDALSMLATAVCCYCLAGLFRETDDPMWRRTGLAVVVGVLLLVRFPNPYLLMLALTLVILCIMDRVPIAGREDGRVVSGILLAVLTLKFFAFEAILSGVLLLVPLLGIAAYYGVLRRWEVGLGSVSALMVFLSVVTYLDRPEVLIGGSLAAPIALAATSLHRLRPSARVMGRALLIALPIVVFFYHRDSLWLSYGNMIPGAVGMRAVGRVVLILLIPSALGLAALVQYLERKRRVAWSWIVALVCFFEQGITTETFDASANRSTITAIAHQVDPGRQAFYYHPAEPQPFYRYQLDAMWASLLTGVPTINGYSGYSPPGWEGFYFIDSDPEVDPEAVLTEWVQSRGLEHNRVQRLGSGFLRGAGSSL